MKATTIRDVRVIKGNQDGDSKIAVQMRQNESN
jgi:hypothetical protein